MLSATQPLYRDKGECLSASGLGGFLLCEREVSGPQAPYVVSDGFLVQPWQAIWHGHVWEERPWSTVLSFN